MSMAATRDKVFKSWSGITEVALIKEVATKGEHIDLCIEYWARKRKLPIPEYKIFFQDVVETYVHRLLTERLFCKAEIVLRNVQCDVKCFFFQFMYDCIDDELRELLLNYLRSKFPNDLQHNAQDFHLYWRVLKILQASQNIVRKYKEKLGRFSLETLKMLDNGLQKQLLVELYFANKSASFLLPHLDKYVVWNFLISAQHFSEIMLWCRCINSDIVQNGKHSDLESMYSTWRIEPMMYENALETLQYPDDVLRNYFATEGIFFTDESNIVCTVLRRVCTTASFKRNAKLLGKLQIGRFIFTNTHIFLLLLDYVNTRELEELADDYIEDKSFLQLIITLKQTDLQTRRSFEQISNAANRYLESNKVYCQNEQPLVIFFEFLSNEPTIANLNCFLLSSALKHIPYLISLTRRLYNNTSFSSTSPTSDQLLQKYAKLNFNQVCKELNESSNDMASFSNTKFCQKYSGIYKINFLHYLKQRRSSYAIYYLLTDHLQQYSQVTKQQLFRACETVTGLALQHYDNTDLITHCVAFNEMLSLNTQNLRTFMKLGRFLDLKYPLNHRFLVVQVERKLLERLRKKPMAFPLVEYQALIRLLANDQNNQGWPELVMYHYAIEDDWWRVLILLHYFEIPEHQLKLMADRFTTHIMGEHLLRALFHEIISSDRLITRNMIRQQKNTQKVNNLTLTTSLETMTSLMSSCNDPNIMPIGFNRGTHQQRFLGLHMNGSVDLFAIILHTTTALTEEHIESVTQFLEIVQDGHLYSTSLNLIKNCVKMRLPILAVFSATINAINTEWNWIVWLAVTTNQWNEVLRVAVEDGEELSWQLIENSVRLGYTTTLYISFCIFYQDNPLLHLFRFLQQTQYWGKQHQDSDEMAELRLRLYLLAWSNDEVTLPICKLMHRDQLKLRTVKLLLIHLQHNFNSIVAQQRYLGSICRSGMSDISGILDFCQLNEIFVLLHSINGWPQRFSINFEHMLERETNKEYKGRLLPALLAAKEYNLAICLASLLHLPICDIVYSKWVTGINENYFEDTVFQHYEDEMEAHSLPPELLVNFFIYAASRLRCTCTHKYLLLKQALNVIKKNHIFPNESFDRDQIEYEMIISYLQIGDIAEVDSFEIYHSEYYEQIMLQDRCVLYKSFLELKELAGIEDLNTSIKPELTDKMQSRLKTLLNRLLDEGDIVEALRLQELFECRPIDLRFVVFCMALAEGVTTIFSMSHEERQLLCDFEKSSFAIFNKRTLGVLHQVLGSATLRANNDLSDSSSTLEFEEIPSKEKRETLDIIQGIVSKLKYGVLIGKRIVMAYRAAMYLDKEYLDVLRTKDATVLLKSVAEEECLHRLLVVNDILKSTHMTPQEIAELFAYNIVTAVVRPRFYIFNSDQHTRNLFKNADLWGYNIDRDLHLFLELVPNTTKLGNCLLDYCDALKLYRKFQNSKIYDNTDILKKLTEIITWYGQPSTNTTNIATSPPQVLSHKKQNLIYVELLIKAHQCFVHECSMEGIANVLNRTKTLNTILTNAKSWSLIVRMLIGIARYREMFYCFDSLIESDQFESLLGHFDEEKSLGLRQAILAYVRDYCSENGKEYFKLAALHFLMYNDLAEMWDQSGQDVLLKVLTKYQISSTQLVEQNATCTLTTGVSGYNKTCIPKLRSSVEMIDLLKEALENYTHATENYLLDKKLLPAQKSASMAELIAMQIDLATQVLDKSSSTQVCVCVVNVQDRYGFRELVNSELRVPQTMILSRAYGYEICWSEAILCQYIVLERTSYLDEYTMHLPITDNIINNVIKG